MRCFQRPDTVRGLHDPARLVSQIVSVLGGAATNDHSTCLCPYVTRCDRDTRDNYRRSCMNMLFNVDARTYTEDEQLS